MFDRQGREVGVRDERADHAVAPHEIGEHFAVPFGRDRYPGSRRREPSRHLIACSIRREGRGKDPRMRRNADERGEARPREANAARAVQRRFEPRTCAIVTRIVAVTR